MILIVGIFCLSLLHTNGVLSVEITNSDNRVERAILGGGGGNHLHEALGGGSPGKDFPTLNMVPKTDFDCHGLLPGYYADENYGCQVFHVCHTDLRKDSFLCPNGTIFHQVKLVCDWWYNVDCASTNLHFDVNLEFGKPSSNFGGGSRTKVVQPPAVTQRVASFQDTSNQAQLGGSRVSSQPSQFGTNAGSRFTSSRGSSAGEQATQFGRGSSPSQPSHFSGNTNDVPSQAIPFGVNKVEQPNFNQFDLDSDKPVLSQTSFNSAPSRSQNHHQSSFQTNFNSQSSPVRARTDSSRIDANQLNDHRQVVKEVKINKRPVSTSGIPFPPSLPRQSDTNLAQRSGRVLPALSQTEADPDPTTISPRSHNFQLPNSLILPPRKVATSVRTPHGSFDANKVSTPINGKVSTVKKVTVNKRPIASISNIGGKQEVRIIDDTRAANQFFNLGTPVQVTPRSNFGRPLPKSDVQPIKKTVTKTRAQVKTQQNNVGRPLPQVNNINNFGRPVPRVQATTQRSTIRNQNFNSVGQPFPPPQSNIRSNVAQNINVGRPLPVNKVHVKTTVAQPFTANRVQGQANNFGRPLPITGNQHVGGLNVRTSSQNKNRGSVKFGTSQLGGTRVGQVTRTRQPATAVNQPTGFTVLVDDDDLDDLNDPFDDDRFDDDRFDDDRFDDDRFDGDKFDDDRFDDDRFDDDRFDDDRFKVRSKFDDDRFDNDPFDDDRFDFDDDDDDDDFDDRRNRFDNGLNFNFGRRPRGSTSSMLVPHKGNSNDDQSRVIEITPPPEIQLPPPLLENNL